MIRFVMINSRHRSFNFVEYTNTIIGKVENDLNATEVEFYSNKDRTRKANIVINKKEYLIQFTYIITHGTFQLKIDISMVGKNELDLELHDLKIKLKDLVITDWEQCVWLEDRQSEAYADSLYKDIHLVENSLRRLINTVLFYKLGGDWWDLYMPIDLTKKYNQRNDPYKRRAPSFENIHTNLMSIDTGDLVKILGYKTYKIKEGNIFRGSSVGLEDPFTDAIQVQVLTIEEKEKLKQFQYIMNNIIYDETAAAHFQTKLSTLLADQLEIDKDFWNDYFSNWFTCDFRQFQGRWGEFNTDRNHVAHNKLIDIKLYEKFKTSMSQLLGIITDAEEKFSAYLETEMSQFLDELEQMNEANLYQSELDYQSLIEEEAGVRIRQHDSIVEIFQEHIANIFDELKEQFYYRSDLEIVYNEPILINETEVFRVDYLSGHTYLKVLADPFIDDSGGTTSYVKLTTIYNGVDLQKGFKISYLNGEVEYNEDQTNYMPLTNDELNVSELKKLQEFIESFINEHMPEVDEDEIAEYACESCHQFTIFLSDEDDGKYEQGKCLHCGHSNPVGGCIRCGSIVNQPTDGLCDSCQEYIDNQ
ncbi:hypothetical protein P4V43_28390 [Brevibacillus fortis]|uniref:hypothetical protein n=1 Tax=Brevibacillus fortis TaxID=2126352 RepID=UPI002E1F09AE|nr:hypothetical protein [Brevibacillus fortis]